jgi:hypothetical protein
MHEPHRRAAYAYRVPMSLISKLIPGWKRPWYVWLSITAVSMLAVADESAGTIITAVVFLLIVAGAIAGFQYHRLSQTPEYQAKKAREDEERHDAWLERHRGRTRVRERDAAIPPFPKQPVFDVICDVHGCDFYKTYNNMPEAENAARQHEWGRLY